MKSIYFSNYNLDLKLTPFINIIGSISSGKTSLLRQMINQTESKGIMLDGKDINSYDINFLRENISAVLNNFTFKTQYVKDELLFYQEKINRKIEESQKNIINFAKFFEIEDILELRIDMLSEYEQAYIKILSLLIINPKILGIDDMLTYLSFDQKLKIIKYAKSKKITIINITTNPEELLLGTDIIILDNNHVIEYDKTENILSNEQLLTKVGMKLPFIVDISSSLDYYDLVKNKFFNMKALIGELWK